MRHPIFHICIHGQRYLSANWVLVKNRDVTNQRFALYLMKNLSCLSFKFYTICMENAFRTMVLFPIFTMAVLCGIVWYLQRVCVKFILIKLINIIFGFKCSAFIWTYKGPLNDGVFKKPPFLLCLNSFQYTNPLEILLLFYFLLCPSP